MKVKLRNTEFFALRSYYNYENTVNNFDKDMFRKGSFCGTNRYSKVKTKFKIVFTCFQLSNHVFFGSVVLFLSYEKC